MFYLKVLGSPSLRRGDFQGETVVGSTKGVAVLAYLAVAPERSAERAHLASLLWPNTSIGAGKRRLRQALYYVRREAGVSFVEPGADPLCLPTGQLMVDLWEFGAAAEAGHYRRAVEIYDGPVLDGFVSECSSEFMSWVDSENAAVRVAVKTAYREVIRELLDDEEASEAIWYARRWVSLNPLDPDAQKALIRTLVRTGDWLSASGAYERYRTLLKRELGATPDDEIRREMKAVRERLG